ncbi:MAG TPA: squalene/phytoene synthase family protein [Sphingomicrobium sp.]|nr:squalene/phytoene synthase family protein [Sphingomicrobium sp.]
MADRRLDHDREVALEQMPRNMRPAFLALWNLDLAFADVVSTSSDPRLGAIRLAWWRERLDDLGAGAAAPSEPRLQAVARELLARGIAGSELSKLEDAWLPQLEPFPWGEAQAEGFRLRGRVLFEVGARLLRGDPRAAMPAGELWALIDGASHCSDARSRDYLLREARSTKPGSRVPRHLRHLTIITAVAVENVRHPSRSIARGMAAVAHRLVGRMPQL